MVGPILTTIISLIVLIALAAYIGHKRAHKSMKHNEMLLARYREKEARLARIGKDEARDIWGSLETLLG